MQCLDPCTVQRRPTDIRDCAPPGLPATGQGVTLQGPSFLGGAHGRPAAFLRGCTLSFSCILGGVHWHAAVAGGKDGPAAGAAVPASRSARSDQCARDARGARLRRANLSPGHSLALESARTPPAAGGGPESARPNPSQISESDIAFCVSIFYCPLRGGGGGDPEL